MPNLGCEGTKHNKVLNWAARRGPKQDVPPFRGVARALLSTSSGEAYTANDQFTVAERFVGAGTVVPEEGSD
jgi:hypothetical protein